MLEPGVTARMLASPPKAFCWETRALRRHRTTPGTLSPSSAPFAAHPEPCVATGPPRER